MDVPNPSVVPSLSPGELLSTKTRSVHYGTFPELWTWMDYVFADYLLGLNGTYITALVVLRSAGLLRSRGLLQNLVVLISYGIWGGVRQSWKEISE
jgi:hypothetical protein